jgi:hypothetical protein
MNPKESARLEHLNLPPPERGTEVSIAIDQAQLNSWMREGELLKEAVKEAETLLEQYPDGISEGVLVELLKSHMKIRLRIASAAIDQLESSGKARKDWGTGFMTPSGNS